jgi:hypothetical protein
MPEAVEVLAVQETPFEVENGGATIARKATDQLQRYRRGWDFARRAVNAFARLGERAEHWQQLCRAALYAGQPIPDAAHVEWGQLKEEVLAFACTFGSLYGDDEDEALTFGEWEKEARKFLQWREVARALARGEYQHLDQRMRMDESEVRYIGPATYDAVARPGEQFVTKDGEILDLLEIARNGSSRDRIWMVFAREINRRLHGGLSLRLDVLSSRGYGLTPKHLIHLVYLRLWLDAIEGDNEPRIRTCPECLKPLPTGSRRNQRFCSDHCRTVWNNKRRALEREKRHRAGE